MNKPLLSVVIPAHNEEMRLANCLEKIIPYLCTRYKNNHEIVIVDNGSTDETFFIARMYAYTYSSISALHLPIRGKGIAVKRGMLFAQGKYRYMCDVDLSTPIEELDKFFKYIVRDYDVVIGSREVDKGMVQSTSLRHFIGRAFHTFCNHLAPGVLDTQCGFKLFRGYAAEAIFHRLQLPSMAFDVEALFIARLLGYRIGEIPVQWQHNPDSRVNLLWDSLHMARDVITIPWLHMQMKIPA